VGNLEEKEYIRRNIINYMQNIKPIEDYKKQIRSEKEQDPELDQEVQDLEDPALDAEDDTEDEVEEIPSAQPSFSAEVPSQIEVESNAPKPYMVITNLKKIADQTSQLIGMIQSSGKVEQWAVDHITTSADDIEEVYNYYKYKD